MCVCLYQHLLPDLLRTAENVQQWLSAIVPGALLQPLLPLPCIIAENNSTPKQSGKCLMILYPSMSRQHQWNIVPWAHISFCARHRAAAGSRERSPGTKFKHHFTPSNDGANGGDGRRENGTWEDCRRWMGMSLCKLFEERLYCTTATTRNAAFSLIDTWNPQIQNTILALEPEGEN